MDYVDTDKTTFVIEITDSTVRIRGRRVPAGTKWKAGERLLKAEMSLNDEKSVLNILKRVITVMEKTRDA